jgi:hypothetical protein
MTSELLKQWQQDVEDYGDNAYLMYSHYYIPANSWIDCDYNNDVIDYESKRKQSAELPFDLERAKCGDEVIILINDEWISCEKNYTIYLNDIGSTVKLRMKYPVKVKK